MSKKIKILALCDSPAVRANPVRGSATTGFARVANNLFTEWTKLGAEIDIWALHFDGWGYDSVPWKLFPGGSVRWNDLKNLSNFLKLMDTGGYTHVFLLSDADALCVGDFPQQLRRIALRANIRTMLYFPVDAALEPEWTEIISAVDVAVTYTEWGAAEAMKAIEHSPGVASRTKIHVLPHGVEEHFKPFSGEDREAMRRDLVVGQRPFASASDFLMLNVNKNEWRKDPLRSLEILALLKQVKVPAKLIMRMAPASVMGGVYLSRAAGQLGLVEGRDWMCLDAVEEKDLPMLYNIADLYLTTTLGEGWGLGITEAYACGVRVALPDWGACREIAGKVNPDATVFLPLEKGSVCGNDTRLRRRVDLAGAVGNIQSVVPLTLPDAAANRWMFSDTAKNWLSWPRIAGEMFKLLTS
jgi:glycosyltransferase involved in cell wall biosynthesis